MKERMFSKRIRKKLEQKLLHYIPLHKTKIHPNVFTFFSWVFKISAIILIIKGQLLYGWIAILLDYLCDAFDGFIARITKKESKLGYFLDILGDRSLRPISIFALSFAGVISKELAILLVLATIPAMVLISEIYYNKKNLKILFVFDLVLLFMYPAYKLGIMQRFVFGIALVQIFLVISNTLNYAIKIKK